MSKRKQVEEYILKYVDKIAPGGFNKKLYQDLFKSMDNKEFDEFMHKLKNKEITLSIIVPNESDIKITMENNTKIAKELNIKFEEPLVYTDDDGNEYKTEKKYVGFKLPVRRQVQLLSKGVAVASHNKSKNLLTGQVTGESASSKMTAPEIQMLVGMGMENTLTEILKYRGGDTGGMNALSQSLFKYGGAKQEILKDYSTGVVSTKTLKAYLMGMHIKSTL